MDKEVERYLADNFEKVRLLKRSDKGEVWLASQGTGKLVIWKHIRYIGIPYVQLKDHHHALWPEIFYVAEDDQETIVIEEYISGRTLAEYIEDEKYLSAKDVFVILTQLCIGLSALHGMGIVHRDIKPSNLIWQDGIVHLIDFDASRIIRQGADADTTLLGTKGYAPPEQFGYSQTDARSDIYAIGVTMQEALGPHYQGKLLNILKKCRRIDPDARYTSAARLRLAVWRCRYREFLIGGLIFVLMILLGMGYYSYRQQDVPLPALLQEVIEPDHKPDASSPNESAEESASKASQEAVEQMPTDSLKQDDATATEKPARKDDSVSCTLWLNGQTGWRGINIAVPPEEWSQWEWRNNKYTEAGRFPDDWVLKVRLENRSNSVLENPRVMITYDHEERTYHGQSLAAGGTETIEVPLNSYRADRWSQFHIMIGADSKQEINENVQSLVISLSKVGAYKMEHAAELYP